MVLNQPIRRSGGVWGFSSTEAEHLNCNTNGLPRGSRFLSNVARGQQVFFFSPFHLLLVDRSSGQRASIQYPHPALDRSMTRSPIHSGKKRSGLRGKK